MNNLNPQRSAELHFSSHEQERSALPVSIAQNRHCTVTDKVQLSGALGPASRTHSAQTCPKVDRTDRERRVLTTGQLIDIGPLLTSNGSAHSRKYERTGCCVSDAVHRFNHAGTSRNVVRNGQPICCSRSIH